MWHCVKVSNIATNFVVKRCKYKYWIAFCRCSRANAVHLICFSFRCNSYGPWTPTKCDSMPKWTTTTFLMSVVDALTEINLNCKGTCTCTVHSFFFWHRVLAQRYTCTLRTITLICLRHTVRSRHVRKKRVITLNPINYDFTNHTFVFYKSNLISLDLSFSMTHWWILEVLSL